MTHLISPFLQMKHLRPRKGRQEPGPRALECQHMPLPGAPQALGREVRRGGSGGMQLDSGCSLKVGQTGFAGGWNGRGGR